ncbi:MAG: primosomal protein N' [Flavobacteriales bacterium]|nr:primosomal protein N' [Flavobacteriales bacterium]
MNSQNTYIEVIIPLPVEGSFTYCLTDKNLDVSVGQRVIVQFGKRKLYTAIVMDIHNREPKLYEAKYVLAVLDEGNVVHPIQIRFWKWIAEYYMSRLGDVMNVALPSSLKLASESKIIVHPDFDGDMGDLTDNENAIITTLTLKEELTLQDAITLIDKTAVFPIINELIRKEVVQIKEELHDSFKKKTLQFVELVGDDFENYFEKVKSAKKQEELLQLIIHYKAQYPKKKWTVTEIVKKSGISRGILNSLVTKEIIKVEVQQISRLISSPEKLEEIKTLSEKQEIAYNEIKNSFKEKDVCLLHGVTSSGKTEIYIKLIQEQLDKGKQVLYLLPEIALTTQIINRLRKHFRNKVGVSHSRMSNNERVEIWNAVKEKDIQKTQYPIMLGARSALFLPFDNLGLIIVDEEHEPSFKQFQPSPRYHARDAAIYLSYLHKAKVLLGSATPSVETYYNTKIGKFALVELNSRFGNMQLPEIHTVDIKKAHLKKQMEYHFSPFLLKHIGAALKKGKQIILFQNRRGYAPLLECNLCSWTPSCNNCDVSLTYHKHTNSLRCHYCGYSADKQLSCKSCGHNEIIDKGFGTEQIEEELKTLFPDAKTQRMDHDTTRKKHSYSQIIDDFERGNTDILIGTQMVTKGLDFDNVEVVGILNADSMLKFPDFRALERAYQLMSQVAGRAGRKGDRGKVIIQTYDEKHEIIHQVKNHDYLQMCRKQLEERKIFKYPPYCRIISVNLQHKNENKLDKLSKQFAISLRKSFGNRVLGPESPGVSKIRTYHHKNILLKIETEASVKDAKKILSKLIEQYRELKDFRAVRINMDVDPY